MSLASVQGRIYLYGSFLIGKLSHICDLYNKKSIQKSTKNYYCGQRSPLCVIYLLLMHEKVSFSNVSLFPCSLLTPETKHWQ